MSTVVISQPALFPWPGMIEHISLSNTYIHHDDLQYPKQWFTNRVQIKSPAGQHWLTIPIEKGPVDTRINEVRVADDEWKAKHLRQFQSFYTKAPYRDDALALMEATYELETDSLNDIVTESMYQVLGYLDLKDRIKFLSSTEMSPEGTKTDRVLWLVRAVGGSRYVTGHGALNYLEHEKFEDAGIDVEYMEYSKTQYPQQHGDFIPYVSVLDLIANVGPDAPGFLHPTTLSWREAVQRFNA